MNIAHNPKIKQELFSRWEKLGLKPSEVIKDANEREPSLKFQPSSFSRWKKGSVSEAGKKLWISDQQALWLCVRWGISVSLDIGVPSLTADGKLQWKIEDYNEETCLRNLKERFAKQPVVKRKKVVKKKK